MKKILLILLLAKTCSLIAMNEIESNDNGDTTRTTSQSWLVNLEINQNLKYYLQKREPYKNIDDLLQIPSYWLVKDKLDLNANADDVITGTPLAYLWKEFCESNANNDKVFTSLCQLLLKNGADPEKAHVAQNTNAFLEWCQKCKKLLVIKDYWQKKADEVRHNFEEYGSKESGPKALWAIRWDNNEKKNELLKEIGIYEDFSEFEKKPQEEKNDILYALDIIHCDTKYFIKAIENGAQPTKRTLWSACFEANREYNPGLEDSKLLFLIACAGLKLSRCDFFKEKWLNHLALKARNDVNIYQFVRHIGIFEIFDEVQFLKGFNPKSNLQETKRYLKRKGLYANPFWQQFKTYQQSEKDAVLEDFELLENNADQEKHMKLAIMFGAQPTIDTLILIYKKDYAQLAKFFITKQKQLKPDEFCFANCNVKSTNVSPEKYAYSYQEINKNSFSRMQKWFNQFIEKSE